MSIKQKLLSGAVFLIVILFFSYLYWAQNTPRLVWTENYRQSYQQPYGAYVLYQLLSRGYDDQLLLLNHALRSDLIVEEEESSAYIFIGRRVYYSEEDLDTLMRFIEVGNQAYLICPRLPSEFWDYLEIYSEDCPYPEPLLKPKVQFSLEENRNKAYSYYYQREEKPGSYRWAYFANADECWENVRILGSIDEEYPNFVRLPYGKGSLYLHTNPLAFSNFHLLDEEKLAYAASVFSNLPEGKIYWDEYSKINRPANPNQRDHPLGYILSQPSLRWAWYLLLAGVILFFVFFSKRKQRLIPILPSNVNSSIEYAETVGRLYYQNENHYKLALKQYQLFQAYIWRYYGIAAGEIHEDHAEKLSLKTGAPLELLLDIFKTQRKIDFKKHIAEKELMHFYGLLDEFYQYASKGSRLLAET